MTRNSDAKKKNIMHSTQLTTLCCRSPGRHSRRKAIIPASLMLVQSKGKIPWPFLVPVLPRRHPINSIPCPYLCAQRPYSSVNKPWGIMIYFTCRAGSCYAILQKKENKCIIMKAEEATHLKVRACILARWMAFRIR